MAPMFFTLKPFGCHLFSVNLGFPWSCYSIRIPLSKSLSKSSTKLGHPKRKFLFQLTTIDFQGFLLLVSGRVVLLPKIGDHLIVDGICLLMLQPDIKYLHLDPQKYSLDPNLSRFPIKYLNMTCVVSIICTVSTWFFQDAFIESQLRTQLQGNFLWKLLCKALTSAQTNKLKHK